MFGGNQSSGFGNTNSGTSFNFGSNNNANNNNAGSGTGFSFGSNNNNNNKPTGFSFGGNNNSTGATGNTGFKFGAGNTTQGSNGSTGLSFGGNNNNSTGSSGFSFGGPKPNGRSLSMGNTNTNTGGFSLNNNNSSTTTGSSSGGFSFGNKSTTPATSTTSTGFSFGNKPSTPATTSSGFSFGKPAGNATSTGLFGNNAAKPSTGFSFGNNNTNTAGTTGGNTFSFGNNTSTQPQQTQQPLQTTLSSQPAFSWSKPQTTNTASQPFAQPVQSQPQQNSTNGYTPTVSDQLEKIKNSWDANSPQCLMKTHFYNKVPQEFNSYQRPSDESPEEWERAMKERPKNYNTIPVKAKGFEDIFKRSSVQIEYIKQSRIILNQINDNLVGLGDKHDLDSSGILLKCKMRQKQLNIKLLKIAINLSILKYKGYPLTNDEERLVMRFKELLDKIDDPIGLNRANELWARLSNLKQRLGNLTSDNSRSATDGGDSEKKPEKKGTKSDGGNDAVLASLVSVLSKEQQGIQYLYEMIEGDSERLAKYEKQH